MPAATAQRPGRWEQAPRPGTIKPAQNCPLSLRVRQRGQKLLNQQFWLWGQDVRHAPNLLARHGFTHYRPPPGSAGSPVYLLGDGELALWGFGLLAQPGGQPPIYVNRFCCEPRLPRTGVAPQDVWLPAQLAPLRVPDTPAAWQASLGVLARTLRWIITYEEWVTSEAGPGYRADCLARWPRTVCPAREIIPAWEQVIRACEVVGQD